MGRAIYGSADEWRAVVIMSLVHQRSTTYVIGIGFALIAIGVICDRWFSYASVICAVTVLIGFVRAYMTTSRDYDKLSKLWAAACENRDTLD